MPTRLRRFRARVAALAVFVPLVGVTSLLACSDTTGPEPWEPFDTPFTFEQVEGTLAAIQLYDASAGGSTILVVDVFGTILQSTYVAAQWEFLGAGSLRPLSGV